MTKASFAQALANLQPDIAPALLFELDTRHMVGVVRITETLTVGGGDILHIPQGVRHGAKIYEEMHILFFTPKEGNVSWSEGKEMSSLVVARHK